ncbi:MAG: 3-isopropylmalate dehydratase small subunit [Pseudomonadota bacterium]
MQPTTAFTTRSVPLPRADIDTDQIIPARFLTTTSREGLGQHLFADWRYLPNGDDNPAFELNQPQHRDAQVLVAGRNFGCGSSREHAPWSLLDYGFKAIISTEIADIFRSNSLKNGLLPIVAPQAFVEKLLQQPCELTIDIEDCTVRINDGAGAGECITFTIDAFSRYCLMHGIDQLGFLLDQMDAIERFEAQHDGHAA